MPPMHNRRTRHRSSATRRGGMNGIGRAVARCAANGDDIGAWLVRTGAARAFSRYSRDDLDEEREAKAARRGILAGPARSPAGLARKAAPEPEVGKRAVGLVDGRTIK